MQNDHYDLITTRNATVLEFESVGLKGVIKKVIAFQEIGIPQLYNLAFGDKKPDSEDFDDTAISNNGDTEIVLATIAYAVAVFADRNPGSWIYATGSSSARNRLYQMKIGKYFGDITKDFEVIAETEENWEPFQKGKNYLAFAIRRKII